MTVLSRRARVRSSGRRPGWLLLTALLVLAIGASSALVFTSRVELLRLAVILALWAAIVAAFVSVIYRRQSDVDQARVRDLKLVYDLQLDREISARREYELTVESQLRRELAAELRAQAADEVAALRAELAALRANLEIVFGTELTHRPALETDRAPGHDHRDWARTSHATPDDRFSNRVTSVRSDEYSGRADEGSIIDVPEEPLPPRPAADTAAGEAAEDAAFYHRSQWRGPGDSGWGTEPRQQENTGQRAEQRGSEDRGWSERTRYGTQPQRWAPPQHEAPPAQSEPAHASPSASPEPQWPRWDTSPAEAPQLTNWQSGRADGRWPEPETPGGTWVPPPSDGVVDAARATAAGASPAAATPPEQRSGRHAGPDEPRIAQPRDDESGWHYNATGRRAQGRHSTDYSGRAADDPPLSSSRSDPGMSWSSRGQHTPPATDAAQPSATPHRHHGRGSSRAGDAAQSAGQSVADLLARLQTEPTGGGRRRRREE